MHFDRKLVCRPGLPKGIAFRSDEMGNGGRFRKNRYRRDPFSDNCAILDRTQIFHQSSGPGLPKGAKHDALIG
ncbi:hypothetical protein KJ359_008676 [Pestalotiopsis sp. 9143b]|nr:hypothetical protein KJ359_008676 [Pestalotiopsis sp. 9143b]